MNKMESINEQRKNKIIKKIYSFLVICKKPPLKNKNIIDI
jgi:hypothetical protein